MADAERRCGNEKGVLLAASGIVSIQFNITPHILNIFKYHVSSYPPILSIVIIIYNTIIIFKNHPFSHQLSIKLFF